MEHDNLGASRQNNHKMETKWQSASRAPGMGSYIVLSVPRLPKKQLPEADVCRALAMRGYPSVSPVRLLGSVPCGVALPGAGGRKVEDDPRWGKGDKQDRYDDSQLCALNAPCCVVHHDEVVEPGGNVCAGHPCASANWQLRVSVPSDSTYGSDHQYAQGGRQHPSSDADRGPVAPPSHHAAHSIYRVNRDTDKGHDKQGHRHRIAPVGCLPVDYRGTSVF